MDPLVPGTRFGRACLLWSAGRHEEAFEIARAAVEEDLYNRMGSRAGFASMVLAVALERGDFELALKPLERNLDEALDPDAEWTANAPWFTRARVLAVLRARGDDALAQKLGQTQLDWSDSAESGLDRSTRLAVRALTFRGLGRVEEALAEYRALRDMGVHPNWRLFFSDPGAWYGRAEDPALLAFREEERAWQAEQRRRLAESGREPPRPLVEPNKAGI